MLPLISKVIESQSQSAKYLSIREICYTPNNLVFEKKKHSADFCLSYLNDKILKGLYKSLIAGMILIDHQKAFDTIGHDVLL